MSDARIKELELEVLTLNAKLNAITEQLVNVSKAGDYGETYTKATSNGQPDDAFFEGQDYGESELADRIKIILSS